MSTNHHDEVTTSTPHNDATTMEGLLGSLDQSITDNATAIEGKAASDHVHVNPVDIPVRWRGLLESSGEILKVLFIRGVGFPAGLTGSRIKADVAATAEAILSIKQDTVEVGTVTFAAASAVGVLAMATETIFADDEVLELIAPAVIDTTLAGIFGTLIGVR